MSSWQGAVQCRLGTPRTRRTEGDRTLVMQTARGRHSRTGPSWRSRTLWRSWAMCNRTFSSSGQNGLTSPLRWLPSCRRMSRCKVLEEGNEVIQGRCHLRLPWHPRTGVVRRVAFRCHLHAVAGSTACFVPKTRRQRSLESRCETPPVRVYVLREDRTLRLARCRDSASEFLGDHGGRTASEEGVEDEIRRIRACQHQLGD